MDEDEVMEVIALQPEEPASKPSPATKTPMLDDEDEGPATYRFIEEPEAPSKKPDRRDRYDDDDDYDEDDDDHVEGADEKADVSVVPDLTVKDPRGIAQELIIRPSNWLMLVTVLDIVLIVVGMAYNLIPIFFSLPPETDRVSTVNPGSPGAAQAQAKESAKKQSGTFGWDTPDFGLAKWLVVLITFLLGGFLLAYEGAIISGCVRMQNLETYGWCIAACIMAMVPIGFLCWLFRLLLGISCLITLKRADVVAGFNYRGE
jgi:hypothetical protein